jgi:acyl carrier protein
MDLINFVKKFAEQFDETPKDSIGPETKFRDLEEWDSLIALSLIAMVDEEYKIKLTGDDIRTSTTVAELFQKVKAKVA